MARFDFFEMLNDVFSPVERARSRLSAAPTRVENATVAFARLPTTENRCCAESINSHGEKSRDENARN